MGTARGWNLLQSPSHLTLPGVLLTLASTRALPCAAIPMMPAEWANATEFHTCCGRQVCQWLPQDLLSAIHPGHSLEPNRRCRGDTLLGPRLLSLGQSAGATDGEFSLNTMPRIWKEYKAAKLWDVFPTEIRMLWKCVGSFPGSPNCCVLNRRQCGPQPCALPGPSSRFGGLGWGPVLLWPCPGAWWLALPVNRCLFCQIQWRCAW